jgi:hypothetical protein
MEFTKFNQRVNAAEPDPRARAKAGGREIAERELAGVPDEALRWGVVPPTMAPRPFLCRARGAPNTRGGRCNASRRPLSRRPRG